MSTGQGNRKMQHEVDSQESDASYCSEESQSHSYSITCEQDRHIGKYNIVDTLSSGGFATAFRARVQSWTRGKWGKKGRNNRKRTRKSNLNDPLVCIKVHHAYEEDVCVNELARREFDICARLEHCSNIVNMHECQQFSHPSTRELFTYTAMELFPMDLQHYVESNQHRGGLSDPEIWEITRQISNGLTAMHTIKFIHCDLKLENILIRPAGENGENDVLKAVICDLGSCHKVGDPLENSGHTLEYSAPEIICECASIIGSHTDVFALGCIIYVLMCGADLFDRALIGEHYIEVLAAQERYSRTSAHIDSIKTNLDYYNRRGILLDNASIAAQQLPLWWEVHQNNLTQKAIEVICGCTEADPEQRLTLDAVRHRLADACINIE